MSLHEVPTQFAVKSVNHISKKKFLFLKINQWYMHVVKIKFEISVPVVLRSAVKLLMWHCHKQFLSNLSILIK